MQQDEVRVGSCISGCLNGSAWRGGLSCRCNEDEGGPAGVHGTDGVKLRLSVIARLA